MPDIFDSLGSENAARKADIFDQIEAQPSRARSIIGAPVKGAIKGAVDIASMADPFKALLGVNELNPHQKQAIETTLPTQNKALEKGLERGGRLAVSALGGPESLLAKGARVAGGAAAGQLAEEAGLPEWAQGLAELGAFASPKFGKKLMPTKPQKEAVEFLRGEGLTDKQIVPLIKSDTFLNRFFTKVSAKGKKTERLAQSIKSSLGSRYDVLKESGKEKFLKGPEVTKFDDRLQDVLDKINPRFSRLIEKDVEALRNKGISQKNLIDFYQDINAIVGKQEGGKAVLNLLKRPIIEGLHKIDPIDAQKFSKLNEFYSKGRRFAKEIKPGIIERLFTGGKALAILGSFVAGISGLGGFGFLPKILGTHTAQVVIRELQQNPRLQNLTLQMSKSLSNNQIPAALRTLKIFEKELRKTNSAAADVILHNLQDHDQSTPHSRDE